MILITDPEHAMPVRIERTGLRTIAVGAGDASALALPYLPSNSDVKSGDLLVTSGLGGVFPAGYPVARVTEVHRDAVQPLAQVRAAPLARVAADGEVMLVWFRPGHPAAPTRRRMRPATCRPATRRCSRCQRRISRPKRRPSTRPRPRPRRSHPMSAASPLGRMLLTAFLGLILTVLPLPSWLEIMRPAFLVLTVLYWSIIAPRTGGMRSASSPASRSMCSRARCSASTRSPSPS